MAILVARVPVSVDSTNSNAVGCCIGRIDVKIRDVANCVACNKSKQLALEWDLLEMLQFVIKLTGIGRMLPIEFSALGKLSQLNVAAGTVAGLSFSFHLSK